MSNQTVRIINKAIQKRDKYNILTFDTHERYQSQLAKTGHNFYSFAAQGAKKWNEVFAPKPSNYYTLPENTIYGGLDIDFILSQSKFGQFQAAQNINQVLGVPVISLEHTLPIPSWSDERLEEMRNMRGDINVTISEYSLGAWYPFKEDTVIHHSVDTELFWSNSEVEKTTEILSVVNDFANRDYCCNYEGWKRITKDLPVKLVGDCEGLSKAASSPKELVKEYQSAKIFLNTSTISPVPTALIEAMACGCAVVSTATCMIPDIINNEINGLISNNEDDLRASIIRLQKDEGLRRALGKHAQQTIKLKFSEENFLTNWNNVFDKAYGLKK